MSIANLTRYNPVSVHNELGKNYGKCIPVAAGEFIKFEEAMKASSNSLQQLKQAITFLERAEKSAIDDNWLKDVRCFLIEELNHD